MPALFGENWNEVEANGMNYMPLFRHVDTPHTHGGMGIQTGAPTPPPSLAFSHTPSDMTFAAQGKGRKSQSMLPYPPLQKHFCCCDPFWGSGPVKEGLPHFDCEGVMSQTPQAPSFCPHCTAPHCNTNNTATTKATPHHPNHTTPHHTTPHHTALRIFPAHQATQSIAINQMLVHFPTCMWTGPTLTQKNAHTVGGEFHSWVI